MDQKTIQLSTKCVIVIIADQVPNFSKVIVAGLPEGPFSHMSGDMGFPKMWYVRLVKAQTSLRTCTV